MPKKGSNLAQTSLEEEGELQDEHFAKTVPESPLIYYLYPMRIVGEIPHPACKITIFAWNNRYLIKLEAGLLEQTFKINQFDVTSEADLHRIADDTFIREAIDRFDDMARSLSAAVARADG